MRCRACCPLPVKDRGRPARGKQNGDRSPFARPTIASVPGNAPQYWAGRRRRDGQEYPPSAQAKLTAVDTALDRANESGECLLDRPDSAALRTLRTLAAEEREAFDAALAGLLAGYAAAHGPAASPKTLLPLVPIALAAFAYRTLGWAPVVHTE
ncbi:Imm49 family immunity protein [Streptomyces avermitilis]|uniref:Imm49 family immunity protein n=1 Tax=Streptomyces avermitilis TaxID=33903 RepID=UPI00367B7537